MNKTLLYVTAAAGLIASGAALADAANVEIYGTLNTDFENVKATGATSTAASGTVVPLGQMVTGINAATGTGAGCANGTNGSVNTSPANCGQPSGVNAPSRNRVTSNSSNIGFRGKEELGMGLSAIFQIESGVSIDNAPGTQSGTGGGTASAGNASSGFLGTRNTNVGLSSKQLGTIFYGNWDTPYKFITANTVFDSFYSTGIANSANLIGTPGFGVQSITTSGRNNNSSDAAFDRRQGNSVQYWSPQFYGISARLLYSANEGRSAEPPGVVGQNTNPTIYGGSVAYEYGPFRAAYSFEQHKDYFGLTQLGGANPTNANTRSRDNGNKATLGYTLDTSLGKTSLNVDFENLAYNNSDTAAGDLIHYDRNQVYFAGKQMIGAHTIRVGFGNAWSGSCYRAGGATPAACSTTGLNAKNTSLGYSYSFSKRTDVYAFYTLINNGNFANYELFSPITATVTSTAGPGVGARQQGIGLGIRHVF
jgi:predicted porin